MTCNPDTRRSTVAQAERTAARWVAPPEAKKAAALFLDLMGVPQRDLDRLVKGKKG
jgi:hypothetical protein